MTKKHFIALADALRNTRPSSTGPLNSIDTAMAIARENQWCLDRDAVADFCYSQNRAFNRERWIDYINGECGPNGGAIKK